MRQEKEDAPKREITDHPVGQGIASFVFLFSWFTRIGLGLEERGNREEKTREDKARKEQEGGGGGKDHTNDQDPRP